MIQQYWIFFAGEIKVGQLAVTTQVLFPLYLSSRQNKQMPRTAYAYYTAA